MANADRLSMDEAAARRVVLVRAIEQADTDGKILGVPEREAIDHDVRRASLAPAQAGEPHERLTTAQFLDARASRVLTTVESRHAALASLKAPQAWTRWLATGVPLAAIVLGVATDIIANPHRVDLIALPLLGILVWNLGMYLALVAGWAMASRGRDSTSFIAQFGRWTDGERALRRRPANAGVQARALFLRQWFAATGELHLHRVKRVLHLSAAGWAVGVILSLLVRGLVVEYRVGWESTFLDANQVHVLLNILRVPALLLFPFQPFTAQDIAALHFSQGGGAAGGARWVLMYVALLVVVVVVPRVALAAWSMLREKQLASGVRLDAADPYYQRIVSLQDAARVQLGIVTHHADDLAALKRVLAQERDAGQVIASSGHGDVLRWVDLSGVQPSVASTEGVPGAVAQWWSRLKGGLASPAMETGPGHEADVILHMVRSHDDEAAGAPLIDSLGLPVVLIGEGIPGALTFDAFGRNWMREHVLLDAIRRVLPEAKAPGFDRIIRAWNEGNQARFSRAMGAVADHLMFSARQSQQVHGEAVTLRNLLPSTRDSQALARQAAMDSIVQRLQESAATLLGRLRELHGLGEQDATALAHEFESNFKVQQSVDAPQAAMAGAATGAAMGASVDLLAGGMTLGAAAAIGALIGGGAAYVAAWKSRPTESGGTLVQLSDDMMQAMTEAALLRYLVVAHFGRPGMPGQASLPAKWRSDVVAEVEADRVQLTPFWSASRTQPHAARMTPALSKQLEALAMRILSRV